MRTYFSHRRLVDWLVASLFGLVLTLAWRNGLLSSPSTRIDDRLFLTTATISATLLGFSLASASFLISHTKSESMELLRNSKSFIQLIQLQQSALWRFLGLMLISLGAFSSYEAAPTMALAAFVTMTVATAITATTLIWSVGAILRLAS